MTRTAHSTPELGDPHHSHAYRLGFRPDIEGLRAIAILLVVAAHAGIDAFAGGFIGVDVFFVLSGYLITGLLLQETRQRGDVNLPAFYARRLRRLLPALVFMVLGTLALASVLLAPWEQLQQIFSAGAALLWLSNLHFAFAQLDYFGPASESNLFLHTWSLGVEEQFYLAWPVLLLLFLGRFSEEGKGLDERRLVWWIAVATAASFALSAYLTITKPIWAYYFPVTRAWQFGVGALALIWSVRHDHANAQIEARSSTQRNSMLLRWAGWLGLAAIVASSLWIDEDMPYPGTVSLIPTLGATLVLLSGTVANRGSVATLLTTRPLQAIGRVSYSWYLWHWPVLLLGMTLVPSGSTLHVAGLVVISLALAALSYHAVERPIRMAPLLARRPTITITSSAAIAAFAVAATVWMHGAASNWASAPEQERYASVRIDLPAIYRYGCDEWFHSARVVECASGPEQPLGTAVLIGDSIGAQWQPALAKAFAQAGWRFIVIKKSACPMVDAPYFYRRIGREYTECAVWRDAALARIAELAPDVVLLGSSKDYPFTEDEWIEGSDRVLERIVWSVGQVRVIRATPTLPFDAPSCLSRQDWRRARLPWLSAEACVADIVDPRGEAIYRWLEAATRRFANADVIDLNEFVCPDGRCTARRGEDLVYRDFQHVTASYMETLTPLVAEVLALATASTQQLGASDG